MANKYVHNFARYVTVYELMDEIYPLLTTLETKKEVLEYLNVTSDELSNYEVDIKITNFKRNIHSGLKLFNFEFASELGSEKRNKLVSDLARYGILESNVDIKELGNLIKEVLENKLLVNELNNLVNFNDQNVRSLLYQYKVVPGDNVLSNFVDLVNRTTNNIDVYQPIVRNKYYDENNYLICEMKMEENKKVNGSCLEKFKGRIYENLDFKNALEAISFRNDNNISDDLDEDTITFMEFIGEEKNNNWPCNLTISKPKRGSIFINYGEHLFINNLENNVPITKEEIKAIIEKLKHDTPQNEFFKHVKRELDIIRKMLKEREELSKLEMEYEKLSDVVKSNISIQKTLSFRTKCLETIAYALNVEFKELEVLYKNRDLLENVNKTISVKVKVISKEPIACKEEGKVLKKF